MSLSSISIDELENIIHRIEAPKDLLRVMMTCKRMMSIVRHHPLWSSLRQRLNLQTSKRHTKKMMLDFDFVMKNICSCCYDESASQFGLCRACRDDTSSINYHNWQIKRCKGTLISIGKKRWLVPDRQELDLQSQRIRKDMQEHKSRIEMIVRRASGIWDV